MRQVFRTLLLIIIIVGLMPASGQGLAAGAQYTSNQFTQPDTINTDWEINQDIPDSYELVGENTDFQLYANKASLAIKVVDRRSGYVWHSNLDEKIEGDRLNKTWTAFASSGISIDYLDEKAISERASITNSEPEITVKNVDQGFEAAVTFLDPSITIVLVVKLEESGISVEIPFESIQESDEAFKLGMLYVYPFFGATRGDSVPGYMFVPDGSGTLIRFSAETKAKNMFYGRYYGQDLGMLGRLPYSPFINRPFKVSIPVTGMVHGYKQNAFLEIVEDGAAYGEIHAHPSGIITNFNFMYNAFIYNESYFQATNRSGAGVTTLQDETNAFDIKIHYRFLTGANSDYVGMARSYQQFLIEKGVLSKKGDADTDIGIKLEFLGGEKEKVILWNQSIPMTTVDQMKNILDDLGIKNLEVVYYGWQPGGASSMPPKRLKLDSKLGSVAQLQSLVEEITSQGGNFSLYLDPQAALRDEGGYSARSDLSMAITNVNTMGYNRHKVNFYFNFDALSERYAALDKDISSTLKAGLALDGIGSMLYSDFKNKNLLNREAAVSRYQSMLEERGSRLAFYLPNDYFYADMDAYYDMPLYNSGYIYTTDAVPFLQIVLAGYVPYYGPALNFSSNIIDDMLRLVDYGIYPSYYVTHDVTAKILDTRSNWIYTSSYSQWEKDIKETYQWMNELLRGVKDQEIVARQVLEEGVVAVDYANGMQIIVNYNERPYTNGEVTVEGKNAIVREVRP
jgi:hypothetical protein